jgi:hypothetical protein
MQVRKAFFFGLNYSFFFTGSLPKSVNMWLSWVEAIFFVGTHIILWGGVWGLPLEMVSPCTNS